MINLTNCKSLNDIARQEFGKANYTNREKCKKLLKEFGIDWKEWLETTKLKEQKHCLNCGKVLTNKDANKFCCRSCAATYNNSRREVSEATRKKISESIQRNNPNFSGEIKPLGSKAKISINRKFNGEKIYCKTCGKELMATQEKFCSQYCKQEYYYKKYIERWKNGEENGLKGVYGLSNHIRKRM